MLLIDRGVAALLLLVSLALPALAEPRLEEVRNALSTLQEHAFTIICYSTPPRFEGRDTAPGQPRTRLLTRAYGRRPDKLQLLISGPLDERRLDTVIYDGTWQSISLFRGEESLQSTRISSSRVSQAIAPPGRPFDTFFYAPGTGVFAGQDVVGTFTDILDLFDFQLSAVQQFEGVRCRVYDGIINRDSANRFLKRSGLRGIEEVLPGYLDFRTRLRLAIDPASNLPLGYSLGPTLEQPDLVATFDRVAEGLALPDSLFTTSASVDERGQPLFFDKTLAVLKARLAAKELQLGSAEWVQARSSIRAKDLPAGLYPLILFDPVQALQLLESKPELWREKDLEGATPLHLLVARGGVKAITQALEAGADIEATDDRQRTPLHLASKAGRLEIVTALLEAGANVDALDGEGNTPLHYAKTSHISRALVSGGAAQEAINEAGRRPPHSPPSSSPGKTGPRLTPGGEMVVAIKANDIKAVERLLKEGFQPDGEVDGGEEFPVTALRLAARTSKETLRPLLAAWRGPMDKQKALDDLLNDAADKATVGLLLSQGANLQALAPNGASLLFSARSDKARLALLESGLDPLSRGPSGESVFQHFFSAREECRDRSILAKALEIALKKTGPAELARAMPQGIDDEGREILPGATPLHLAAVAGEEFWVEWLVTHQAPVDSLSKEGWTPLHLAAVGGHDAIVKVLLERDASLSTPEDNGWTALHSASYTEHPSTVALLLEHGADVDAVDASGNSPLHLASARGNESIVKLLRKAGARADLKNRAGQSPAELIPSHASSQPKELLR